MVAIIGSLIHVDIRYLQEIGTCRQKFILGLIVRHAAEAFQVIVTTDDKGILRGSVSGQVRRLVVRIENPYRTFRYLYPASQPIFIPSGIGLGLCYDRSSQVQQPIDAFFQSGVEGQDRLTIQTYVPSLAGNDRAVFRTHRTDKLGVMEILRLVLQGDYILRALERVSVSRRRDSRIVIVLAGEQ